MAPKATVFVVIDHAASSGREAFRGVFKTEAAAQATVNTESDQSANLIVTETEVQVTSKAKTTSGKGTKRKSATPDTDGVQVDDDAPPAKKATSKKVDKRTVIPDGEAGSLDGVKLLFTGTFEINRETCETTAEKYGAEIVKKLEDADYAVVGTKPGPKKVEEIAKLNLDQLTETEFLELLKTGVSEDKRDRMQDAEAERENAREAKAAATAAKKQKK